MARVLLVEDEQRGLNIKEMLDRLGYSVLAQVKSSEALLTAQRVRPDVVVMNVHVENGAGTNQAIDTIRMKLGIAVVLVTGIEERTNSQPAATNPALACLAQPFSERELRSAIEVARYRCAADQRLSELRSVTAADPAQLAARLALSNQLAALDALATGVARELSNPLAHIIVSLDAALTAARAVDLHLAKHPEIAPPTSVELLHNCVENLLAALHTVEHASDRMRMTVKGLHRSSHASQDDMELVDLKAVIIAAVSVTQAAVQKRARVVTEFHATPIVRAERAKLSQFFVNLLMNAAQAIPEGNADENSIKVVVRIDAERRAVAEVRDSGCGIEREQLPKIFDPFYTNSSNHGRLGLGLWLCREIAIALGGELSVESKLGVGSVFRLTLPSAEQDHADASGSRQKASIGRCKLLLVDDDKMVLTALARSLDREHNVTKCASGLDALNCLRSGQEFDIVLCDLMMPHMNGLELYAEIARHFPGYVRRIIFLTGGALSEQARNFLEVIPNRRLSKPFRINELFSAMAEVIRETDEQTRQTMAG